MEAILNLSKTEKTLAILFIAVLAFLILRQYYKKPSESGFRNSHGCNPPKPVWNGWTCVDKLKPSYE